MINLHMTHATKKEGFTALTDRGLLLSRFLGASLGISFEHKKFARQRCKNEPVPNETVIN